MPFPLSPGTSSRIKLALSHQEGDLGELTDWAGPLVALGNLARRYLSQLVNRQLVITISVPRRELAAVLIGMGWVLDAKPQMLPPPEDVLRDLEARTPVRIVTDRYVIADYLKGIDWESVPVRVQLSQTSWVLAKVEAAVVLPQLESPMRTPRKGIGSVGRWAGLTPRWHKELAGPAQDLAIIGTLKWLREDAKAFVSLIEGTALPESGVENSTIASLILPEDRGAATWSTRFYSSSRIADELPLPEGIRAVVLDGSGAIKYLDAIESELVFCVLDRSVADETADEMLVQRRNTRGEPVSLRDHLGWRPLAGMEALAFTVAL